MTVAALISKLDQEGKIPLSQKEVLRSLLEISVRSHRMAHLLDAAFHAKFLTKAQEVMKRIGPNGEGYDKLALEFQTSVGKVCEQLRTVVEGDPLAGRLETEFLALDQQSFSTFLSLASDLTRLKNWEVDGNPMPSELSDVPRGTSIADFSNAEIGLLVRLAFLLCALVIAFITLEPPVSTLGIAVAGVTVLVAIVLAVQLFKWKNAFKKG